jgi:tetratricopeptide (TPR) repeat protein
MHSLIKQLVRSFLVIAFITMAGAGCSDPSGQRELRAGIRELKRENYVRAKSLLERSINRRPGHLDNARTHNYLGIAAWGLKQYSEAMTAFEDSRRLNPNLVEPVYNMGLLSAERGDFREAARYLNEAATMNRSDPRPLEFLAELYIQRGQWSQARNTLYTALDRDPRSARIYNSIASAHAGMQQPDQAIEALMFALEYDTKYAPALLNLAVVYDTLVGDTDQARAYYKRFVSAASSDERVEQVRAALTRLDETGALKIPAAQTGSELPPVELTQVISETQEIVAEPTQVVAEEIVPQTQVAPTSAPVVEVVSPPAATPPATPSAYDNFMSQAGEKAGAGQLQQAIDTYVKAAEAAAAANRIDLQENAYQEAVNKALDQPRAHALLGQHLFERGRYEQSAKSFRTAAALNEDYAPAQLGLARLAVRNNESDAAAVHYRKAMASDPLLADAFWEYAQLFDKQLELPENAARAYREFASNFPADRRQKPALDRAEELAPAPRAPAPSEQTTAAPSPSTRGGDARDVIAQKLDYRPPATRNVTAGIQAFNRGVSYQRQQNWDNAVFFFLRSLEQDDSQPSAFYNLGICLTMKGNRELARDSYQYALRLDPALKDAKYNLALLQRDLGDETAAITLLQDIVKQDPGYANAHHLLGAMYAASPRTRALAREHYERFLAIAPNDRSAPAIRQWLQNNN